MTTHLGRVAALLAVLAFGGCAQTTVRPQQEAIGTGYPRPGRVLVFDLAVTPAEVTANQSIVAQAIDSAQGTNQTEQAIEIGHQVANAFAQDLVDGIRKLGLNAERADRGTPIYDTDVLVLGRFIDVNEGNRLQRLVIGFGMGASTLDAEVYVYQQLRSGRRQLLQFAVHADSGKMPGAAVTMGAGAAAQGGVTAGMAAANVGVSGIKGYRSQIDELASRSAGKATAFISDFAGGQGWILPEQVESTKSMF